MSRRKPSPISLEWKRIAFDALREDDGRYKPEEAEAWRNPWENHIEGDRLARTDVLDAQLICNLGWSLAIQQERYTEAIDRQGRLFEHPDIERISSWEQADHRCNIALARLQNGDTTQAVSDYRSILTGLAAKDIRSIRPLVRNHLFHFAEQQSSSSTVPESLQNLAINMLELYSGQKRRLRILKAQPPTYAALAAALQTHQA